MGSYILDNDPEIPPTLFERADFLAYCKAILGVLGREPTSIAALHRKLGEKANPRLTCDALDWMADEIDNDGKLPCGYFLRSEKKTVKAKKWNGAFAGADRYAMAKPH